MSRKTARDSVFKIVFEECVIGEFNETTFALLTSGITADDLDFITKTHQGITDKYTFLKSIVLKYSVGFALERIYKIDLAILLVATYEILFTDIPEKVAANEAIELAKTYSTDKSSPFINGVLASVIREKKEILETKIEEPELGEKLKEEEQIDKAQMPINEKEESENGI